MKYPEDQNLMNLSLLKKSFNIFINSRGESVSVKVKNKILTQVKGDLQPSYGIVFLKLTIIHLFVSLLTLNLCPQFGIGLWGHHLGLMKIFIQFGPIACTFACGAFYMGSSVCVAGFVLSIQEYRSLKKLFAPFILILILGSLGLFVMLDAQIIWHSAFLWALGSLLGSSVSFFGILSLRTKGAY